MPTSNVSLNFILKKIHKEKFILKNIVHFQKGIDELEKLGVLKLLTVFQSYDLFLSKKEIYNISEIKHKIKMLPKYDRVLKSLLELLIRYGYIKALQHDIYELTNELRSTVIEIEQSFSNLVLSSPEIAINAKLLNNALSAQFDVMSGKQDFLPIMFPSGSFEIIEHIYKLSPDATYYNKLVSLIAKYYSEYLMETYCIPISIIELGAGIGSSTEHVLSLLPKKGSCFSYVFTDISTAFIKNAKLKFKKYDFVSFEILNIDQLAESQKITQQYDAVIATNVLHAAKNILTTLKNIKKLLKPSGILIINDAVAKKDFSTLAYGLIDGWWAFQDDKWRIDGSPFITLSQWKELLSLSGFQQTASLNELLKPNIQAYQDIIISATPPMSS